MAIDADAEKTRDSPRYSFMKIELRWFRAVMLGQADPEDVRKLILAMALLGSCLDLAFVISSANMQLGERVLGELSFVQIASCPL